MLARGAFEQDRCGIVRSREYGGIAELVALGMVLNKFPAPGRPSHTRVRVDEPFPVTVYVLALGDVERAQLR